MSQDSALQHSFLDPNKQFCEPNTTINSILQMRKPKQIN